MSTKGGHNKGRMRARVLVVNIDTPYGNRKKEKTNAEGLGGIFYIYQLAFVAKIRLYVLYVLYVLGQNRLISPSLENYIFPLLTIRCSHALSGFLFPFCIYFIFKLQFPFCLLSFLLSFTFSSFFSSPVSHFFKYTGTGTLAKNNFCKVRSKIKSAPIFSMAY
jgi:hypothetical protein